MRAIASRARCSARARRCGPQGSDRAGARHGEPLLLGPPGAGKEAVARAVHQRRDEAAPSSW